MLFDKDDENEKNQRKQKKTTYIYTIPTHIWKTQEEQQPRTATNAKRAAKRKEN